MLKTLTSAIVLMVGVGPALAQDWSIDLYGGKALDGSLVWDGSSFDTDNGKAVGVSAYNTAWVQGLALGVDIMSGGVDYTGYTDSIAGKSVMLAGRYDMPLSGGLVATFGAGVGAMRVSYDAGSEASFSSTSSTVAGGQVELGLRYQMNGGLNVFSAVKYQAAFDDVEFDNGLVAEYNTTNVVVGVSFDM